LWGVLPNRGKIKKEKEGKYCFPQITKVYQKTSLGKRGGGENVGQMMEKVGRRKRLRGTEFD